MTRTVLTELERLTGRKPTAQQIERAHKRGGLHDPDTIASLPAQIEALTLRKYRYYGRMPTDAEVARDVHVGRWELARKARWAQPYSGRDRTDEVIAAHIAGIITAIYVRLFGRFADREKEPFWFVHMHKLVNHFEHAIARGADPEDKAWMEARDG